LLLLSCCNKVLTVVIILLGLLGLTFGPAGHSCSTLQGHSKHFWQSFAATQQRCLVLLLSCL
jgi:hypothetical protein